LALRVLDQGELQDVGGYVADAVRTDADRQKLEFLDVPETSLREGLVGRHEFRYQGVELDSKPAAAAGTTGVSEANLIDLGEVHEAIQLAPVTVACRLEPAAKDG
jgi:hypothetical protein